MIFVNSVGQGTAGRPCLCSTHVSGASARTGMAGGPFFWRPGAWSEWLKGRAQLRLSTTQSKRGLRVAAVSMEEQIRRADIPRKRKMLGHVQRRSQRSHKGTAIISYWSRQSQASSDLRAGDMEPTIGVSVNWGPSPKTTKDNKRHLDLNRVWCLHPCFSLYD